MSQSPRINADVAALLESRVVSQQLLEDVSQLLHKHRNAAFSSGFKSGWNDAIDKIYSHLAGVKYYQPEATVNDKTN